ncbi:uncharacterized protein RAG0_12318 [Rhynchosporium agropyri]|uniref:Uncharacterized protein n=1 Tax=Rhynchosporium agropyri TaxID=914238 RepID=A0A1E1L7X9_9HELO|nr:uncharacterized protein RAG0_12318 [Rhynchosporium agropyri]
MPGLSTLIDTSSHLLEVYHSNEPELGTLPHIITSTPRIDNQADFHQSLSIDPALLTLAERFSFDTENFQLIQPTNFGDVPEIPAACFVYDEASPLDIPVSDEIEPIEGSANSNLDSIGDFNDNFAEWDPTLFSYLD